jgi:5'-nucleotidase (lipoprotein e(P4) family)
MIPSRLNVTLRPLLIAAATLALAACTTAGTATRDGATTAGPPAHDELYALAWMQTSTEYDALNRTVYTAARVQFDRALADPLWDALPPTERARTTADVRSLPPAIILDIDETVLENTPFNAEMFEHPLDESKPAVEWKKDFDARWEQWVKRAAAPRMAGAKEFLDYVASRGVAIFYVTNRACAPGDPGCEEEATCRNLVEQQLPLADCETNLLLRYEEQPWLADREKGTRRMAVGKTHRVLMLFGDNLGDFVDGIYGTVDQRARLACGARQWWGERWMMLPNPIYGSWVVAVAATGAGPFPTQSARVNIARTNARAALVPADADDVTDRLNSDCDVE